jgi:hypothetical protein
MQTLTIQVTNQNALETLHILEEKHFIKIVDDSALHSPALPGNPLSLEAFKNWITNAEDAPAISLNDAKKEWESKRKKLIKLTL